MKISMTFSDLTPSEASALARLAGTADAPGATLAPPQSAAAIGGPLQLDFSSQVEAASSEKKSSSAKKTSTKQATNVAPPVTTTLRENTFSAPAVVPASSAPLTLEDVRTALRDLQNRADANTVKDLIRSFGVNTLPQIPEEKYQAVINKAREMANQ